MCTQDGECCEQSHLTICSLSLSLSLKKDTEETIEMEMKKKKAEVLQWSDN